MADFPSATWVFISFLEIPLKYYNPLFNMDLDRRKLEGEIKITDLKIEQQKKRKEFNEMKE